MTRVKVSAPGKLHLLGEHAVVYNKPAILVAVDKRCFIEIIPRNDKKIKITSKTYKIPVGSSFGELHNKFEKAQKDWETFNESNNISLLKSITKEPLDYPQIIIGQFLNYYKIKKIQGFDLIIDSQIPVGAGMGSSAALAVSVIGALSLFVSKLFNKKTVNKIAFLCEQKKHGNPSGGDNSASCFGGLVWFEKDEGIKPLTVVLSEEVTKNFYIINTGVPNETTGEMISLVKNKMLKNKRQIEKILSDQGNLVPKLVPALKKANHEEIIQILQNGEANLERLGVVSEFVQSLIRKVEKSGGAAKICGAGGITKATGIILIYANNNKIIKDIEKSYGFVSSPVNLGAEGLRQE